MRLITLADLRAKIGGRSRNAIFADIENGALPKPLKLGSLNYWVEEDVDAALRALAGPDFIGASVEQPDV